MIRTFLCYFCICNIELCRWFSIYYDRLLFLKLLMLLMLSAISCWGLLRSGSCTEWLMIYCFFLRNDLRHLSLFLTSWWLELLFCLGKRWGSLFYSMIIINKFNKLQSLSLIIIAGSLFKLEDSDWCGSWEGIIFGTL